MLQENKRYAARMYVLRTYMLLLIRTLIGTFLVCCFVLGVALLCCANAFLLCSRLNGVRTHSYIFTIRLRCCCIKCSRTYINAGSRQLCGCLLVSLSSGMYERTGTAKHGTARHSTAQHGTARHRTQSTTAHGTVFVYKG